MIKIVLSPKPDNIPVSEPSIGFTDEDRMDLMVDIYGKDGDSLADQKCYVINELLNIIFEHEQYLKGISITKGIPVQTIEILVQFKNGGIVVSSPELDKVPVTVAILKTIVNGGCCLAEYYGRLIMRQLPFLYKELKNSSTEIKQQDEMPSFMNN